MARNSEVVRQWEILRAVDGARNGIVIGKLAAQLNVCARTIRRDLYALCRAGFPLYDEKMNGTSMWKLNARPFNRLEDMGLGLMELCALYFSRTMLATLAGAPLVDDAERAFMKIEKALPVACRKFLDRLPTVLKAKAEGRKKGDDRRIKELLGRALDATLLHRRAEMRYASASSRRTKDYVVEAQRIVYAHGGIYLVAWVPEYREMRTFAAERIETFGLMDETFTPRPLPTEPFADSMGVNTGPPERIVVEFDPSIAAFIREREWHRSQVMTELEGGTLRVSLDVCNDRALVAWILGFGPGARAVSPACPGAGDLRSGRPHPPAI
ncbi:MAG: WYL domain-containing transcriptional regulator [Acidobacteria bacterium]|nr:WYL domain-containing transcriptional regulator [Acidobacteriota bacterium]